MKLKIIKKIKDIYTDFPNVYNSFTAKEFKNIIISYRFMNMRPSIIFEINRF